MADDNIPNSHIARMKFELDTLEGNLKKLEVFLMNGDHSKLNRTQVQLLNVQADAMRTYGRVLMFRIEHDEAIAEAEAEHEALAAATLNSDDNADSEQS